MAPSPEAAALRRRALLAAPLLALAARAGAQEGWPTRPVRIVAPFPPGGTVDILARLTATWLQEAIGQPFVVENRSGAGGNIGAVAVARAQPDGYTPLMGSPGTQAINAHLYANPGYDGIADFAPISLVAEVPNLLAAHPSLGVQDAAGLIALAKEKRLAYGETSIGGSTHLSAELLRLQAGIEGEHVTYRGSSPMLADLLPGRIAWGVDNLPSILPHIRAGSLTAIGVTSRARWSGAPEIPAIAETLPGYEVTAWFGLLAPKGTPEGVIRTVNAALARMLGTPGAAQRLAELGATPIPCTPEAYRAHILAEHGKWGEVIRRAGIRLE
ncbi:tripartite tricarboxylate transporter substrate binding protein [Siccirubricoccus sp. KC 17139]|uniref:Tripartite tricarboxylate transporter substrate binding protein n=1 Tax=Siccirubricoccus soli TaxID=2899147 RepID=A0ABT1DBR6_9PROT|nr:tripartite tricarboxylate transporter substrate binding protein [Siccirubricoccus soli]MCO6419379.1 tripartite tricarboxylate transporter substrate binding protein [Siccirubricoccus soli]MCP2685514.1 tripartite tricarboxylate transporter substrate binding protein [Siccirubricoccus soli]